MRTYSYSMLVTDQSGEPWLTEGTVKVSPADPYALILMTALAQATEKLTKAHVHLADIMEFSVVKADLPAKGGDEVAGANDVRQTGFTGLTSDTTAPRWVRAAASVLLAPRFATAVLAEGSNYQVAVKSATLTGFTGLSSDTTAL